MRSFNIILFLLLFYSGAGLRAQPLLLHDGLQSAMLHHQLYYFEDPHARYTFEQISAPAFADSFKLANAHVPNFGFFKGPHWFRFQVSNKTTHFKEYYLELAYPPLDSISYYYQDQQGAWKTHHTGDMMPFNERWAGFTSFMFPIPGYHSEQALYFRIKTEGALTTPFYIRSAANLQESNAISYFKWGLYYGAIIIILLYNLFIYFSLRLKPYLFYCCYLLFFLLSQASLNGHWQQFIWRYGGAFNNIVSGFTLLMSIGFALLFTINFIQTRRLVPVLHRIMSRLTIVVFLVGSLFLFGFHQYIVALIPAVYMLVVICIICAAGLAWIKGLKTARLFLLAWVIFLLGLFSYSLQSMGLWGDLETATNWVMAGAVGEALLLSLALADKIRQYRRDRQLANERLLATYREKNELMEQRVLERTDKLQEKQKEIIKQNRQLVTQQQLIEEQNVQLSTLNDNLEKIVSSRTGELRKANLALHKRNQQLEQFAYIISHNLRGPVASILGLIRLFDRKAIQGAENLKYLEMLDQSVNKLDLVISDLGQVLVLEQSPDKQIQQINLRSSVQGILAKLQLQIQETVPHIECELEQEQIYSHPAYLESMLYNLISNALKYRNPEQQPYLRIQSWQEEENVFISVTDKGLGIDLDQYGNRLFLLYQRFHIHKEGRGLGLYMVKRQAESLGGNITVVSQPGKGSTFTLCLPQRRELQV